MRADLDVRDDELEELTLDPPEASTIELDGTLDAYVERALRASPRIRVAFEHWRGAVLRISRARRPPEPTVMYGYFISSVQTRVGPQRHRVSAQQSFPWPTKLLAAADAVSTQARAQEQRVDAEALALRRHVEDAYWHLWLVRTTRDVHRDTLEVLAGLAEAARGRLEVGAVTLADVQQVELAITRLDDVVAGLGEQEHAAEAELAAAIAVAAGAELRTVDEPPPEALVAEEEDALRAAVAAHPMLESFALMAEASEADARSQEADFFPSFTIGIDWIETGDSAVAMPDSGTDALIASVGLRVPLWVDSYADAVAAAHADARAHRAERRGALDEALAQLETALAHLRDARRRVLLYRGTLIPQARTALESVLGSYATGRSTIAAMLLAERDLLELGVGLAQARAEHAVAWARLDELAAHRVARTATDRSAP